MENNNRQILIFALIITILCFIAVFIFNLPSFIKQFGLDTNATSNIGSAIGGITAPVIGIISAILLYLALTRQTQSNAIQRLKNESDIIFLLLNQLDHEISSFYFSFTQTKGEEKKEFSYTGIQAFNVFVQHLNKESAFTNYKHTFKSFYQAKQIILVIRSFSLIEKRIEISEISKEFKDMFSQKLDSIYHCRLQGSLEILIGIVDKNPHIGDDLTEEIKYFFERHN